MKVYGRLFSSLFLLIFPGFALIISQGFNSKFANGWIVGFEDTAEAVNDMAHYLREHQLAALWYHPHEDVSTMMIAYASGASNWEFLDADITSQPVSNLRIVARGYLPPISSIRSAPVTESPVKSNVPTRDDKLRETTTTITELILKNVNGSVD